MAYVGSSSYLDSSSSTYGDDDWDYDTTSTSTYAPRRIAYTAQETTSSYRRGTVHLDPTPSSSSISAGYYTTTSESRYPQSSSSSYHTSSSPVSYSKPSSSGYSSHRALLGSATEYTSAAYPPSPRSTPLLASGGSSSRTSQASSLTFVPMPPHTPDIGRLGTPDIAPVSSSLRFCSCCAGEEHLVDEDEYHYGRAKMDSQLQYAMSHISSRSSSSRKSTSGRLLKN